MKILYVTDAGLPTPRAHGIQIAKVCESLGRTAELELFVPDRKNSITEDFFSYYDIDRTFKIKLVPCADFLSWTGVLGFFFHIFSFYWEARKISKFTDFDCVYSRDLVAPIFFTDVVIEVHNLPRISTWFHRRVFARAKSFVAKTTFVKEELVKRFGVDESKITVIPNGIDIDDFNCRESMEEVRNKLRLPIDKKTALYTGSLQSWKGVDVFLYAAEKIINVLFVIVGGDDKSVEEKKRKFPSRNIIFFGQRPHRDMPLFMRAADVLVLPNAAGTDVSEKYTSPLKLFEYMAAGKPIIASDLPSIREIVSDTDVFFFKPNDVSSLEMAIKQVFSDPQGSSRRAHNSYELAASFSWSRYVRKIVDIMSKPCVEY